MQKIVFGKPDIRPEDLANLKETVESGWIGDGPKTKQFTGKFSRYIGCNYAIPVNSCTSALFLSLKVLGIGHGDEVITTPMTYASTANVIEHVGAKPVFVDVEPDTGLINHALIENAITQNTKAIIPVHLYGRPCNLMWLNSICADANIHLIEDAAHAIEALSGGTKIGDSDSLTCFSFYATKNIGMSDGGMITTNNPSHVEDLRLLSNSGVDKTAWHRYGSSGYKHYEVMCAGYKCNMTDLQASLGIGQLDRIEASLSRRNEIWNAYDVCLSDLPITLPPKVRDEDVHARHLYTILAKDKDERERLLAGLQAHGIGCGVHYVGLHMQPFYRGKYALKESDFPVATDMGNRTLSLPIYPQMTDEEVDSVVTVLKRLF